MKAAHRKELEKNILADRLGRIAVNIQKPPPRRTWMIVGAVAVLFIVLFVGYRMRTLAQYASAQRWVEFDDGYNEDITELIRKNSSENVGKAARFQVTWMRLWDLGIKKLAADPKSALSSLQEAEGSYTALAKSCQNDPVWEAEALYGLAVIEETRAVQKLSHLDRARELFDELAKKHPEAVHGQLAKERAAKLKDGSATRTSIERFYRDLQASLPQLSIK